MGKPVLLELLEALPESELEAIVLSVLREKFFGGDWGAANAILERILAGKARSSFKAAAAGFGVLMAVRARDCQKALERYHILDELAEGASVTTVLAQALNELADLLLPDEGKLFVSLWQKAMQGKLPQEAREKLAEPGARLDKDEAV